ncbi:MAG: alpha/beta hydrolase [Pseudoxanthomonas sp.]
MEVVPQGQTLNGVTHHRAAVNGTELHYVTAGDHGSPWLLVHGFPESWWAFHKLIPLLAKHHQVIAVDLRGFGDSRVARSEDSSADLAEDLHALLEQLDVGPVHLLVQDISGGVGFRLATSHPEQVASLVGIETGLAGFGLEGLADVAKGGAWYIGVLATAEAADTFFAGREQSLLGEFLFPHGTARLEAVAREDVTEFVRGFARPNGWNGARALYSSMLREAEELKGIAISDPLKLPTLAVDHHGSDFTAKGLGAVHTGKVEAEAIDGVGHYIALEAPEALAEALLRFARSAECTGPAR